jgi:hypothetical protein
MMVRSSLVTGWLLGCNVTAGGTTGGVEQPALGDCPRGIAALQSDYQSSEVALLSPEGVVKSAAFLSSASTETTGLAAPLSGDVTVAPARSLQGELVLIDRLGTNVLSFADPKTAKVRAQLPLGTGFDSNPQDYVQVTDRKAYVSRLGHNRNPGRQAFDSGSDLLIIDPVLPEIVGSVAMPVTRGYLPNPAALSSLGGNAVVVLQHALPDYSGMGDSELVAVSPETDEIAYRLPLAGLQNCGRLETSPAGTQLAIACSAFVDANGAVSKLSASGLVLLDGATEPPTERVRFTAEELIGQPIQSSIEFVSETVLLLKSQTALGAPQDNQLYSLNLESGKLTLLATAARSEAGLGYGVALGGMCCLPGCGNHCVVADASRGKLLHFEWDGAQLLAAPNIVIEGAGLPPTGLAPYW